MADKMYSLWGLVHKSHWRVNLYAFYSLYGYDFLDGYDPHSDLGSQRLQLETKHTKKKKESEFQIQYCRRAAKQEYLFLTEIRLGSKPLSLRNLSVMSSNLYNNIPSKMNYFQYFSFVSSDCGWAPNQNGKYWKK